MSNKRPRTVDERPRSVGDLKASGYRTLSVKDEIRGNLIRMTQEGETLFPGIVGYEDSVVPPMVNALQIPLGRLQVLLLPILTVFTVLHPRSTSAP